VLIFTSIIDTAYVVIFAFFIAMPCPVIYTSNRGELTDMVSKVFSALPMGFEGKIIEIEADTSNGLPGFAMVGMANKTVEESKERIRSAIKNSGFNFPNRKLIINLAPAELRKDGTHLDMAIAIAIMTRQGVLEHGKFQEDSLFAGELALDGTFRAVGGIINIIEAARAQHFERIFIPIDNVEQAQLVEGIEIVGVEKLVDLVAFLSQHSQKSSVVNITTLPKNRPVIEQKLQHLSAKNTYLKGWRPQNPEEPFLDNILGQEMAKRALVIAIAGRHNILFHGPPGSGKTMLARLSQNLLPPLAPDEEIDVVKVNNLIDASKERPTRPLRSPHHTASSAAIIGGGSRSEPGEISLAHRGVLFMDEIPEYSRSVLEALRQPLEDRKITISRVNAKVCYPANFLLIATMNPCPCGFFGDPHNECKCTGAQIYAYNKKLSGPLLDRFDMMVRVAKVDNNSLIQSCRNKVLLKTQHEKAMEDISKVSEGQYDRFGCCNSYNSTMTSDYIKSKLGMSSDALNLLSEASKKLNLSARSYFKVIRLARTIADMACDEDIDTKHIGEALQYRQEIKISI
jgi:magnesium chelatase family protein